jgi:hypothetical protein
MSSLRVNSDHQSYNSTSLSNNWSAYKNTVPKGTLEKRFARISLGNKIY